MPIYTKTGDKGMTSIRSSQTPRVWKNEARVDSYGTVDELNTVLGVVLAFVELSSIKKKEYIQKILLLIQNDLFFIGSYLATPESSFDGVNFTEHTRQFEKEIDTMTASMADLRNFILPGGGIVGSHLQLARTVSRRAERRLVALHRKEPIDESVLVFINRLSDLLFTLSRYANFLENKDEVVWRREK